MSTSAESKTDESHAHDQHFKPGQKYATPAPGNGDRVFYETLIEQRPDSEMAQEWCLNYGILEWARAKKLYETVCKRKGRTAIAYSATAPKIKTESPVKKAAPKAAPAAKKRKIIDDEVVDTGFASSSVWEGQGSSGI